MRKQRVVFTNFGMPREEREEPTDSQKAYAFNCMLLEIASNWDTAKALIDEIYNKGKKDLDPIEREWINFLMSNSINIDSEEDADDFIQKFWKG